jgi:hypothetical protein
MAQQTRGEGPVVFKATHTLSPDLSMNKISMAKKIKTNLIF